jgi:hypothetical protein
MVARLALVAVLLLCVCGTATAAVPKWAKNCEAVNKRYPHGVGKVGARDKVLPGNEPVTTFKRSNALYAIAKGRDRDKDGVACEKD